MQFSGAAEQAERMRVARDAGELPPRATKTPASPGTRSHRRNHSDSSAMRMLSVMSPASILAGGTAQSLGKRTPEEGGTGGVAQSCGAVSKYQRQGGDGDTGSMAPPFGLPSAASRDDYNWRQVISALVSDNQSPPIQPPPQPKVVVKSESSNNLHNTASFSFDHTLGMLGSSSLDVMGGFMNQHLTSLASESADELLGSPVLRSKGGGGGVLLENESIISKSRHRRSLSAPSRDFMEFFHPGPGAAHTGGAGGVDSIPLLSMKSMSTDGADPSGPVLKVSSEDWHDPWRVNSREENDDTLALSFHSTSHDEGFFEKGAVLHSSHFKSRSDSADLPDDLGFGPTGGRGGGGVGLLGEQLGSTGRRPALSQYKMNKASRLAAQPPPLSSWNDFPQPLPSVRGAGAGSDDHEDNIGAFEITGPSSISAKGQ